MKGLQKLRIAMTKDKHSEGRLNTAKQGGRPAVLMQEHILLLELAAKLDRLADPQVCTATIRTEL